MSYDTPSDPHTYTGWIVIQTGEHTVAYWFPVVRTLCHAHTGWLTPQADTLPPRAAQCACTHCWVVGEVPLQHAPFVTKLSQASTTDSPHVF